jgi:hypothetical protein
MSGALGTTTEPTPWSKSRYSEVPSLTQMVKKFLDIYGKWRFVSVHKSSPMDLIQSRMNPHILLL